MPSWGVSACLLLEFDNPKGVMFIIGSERWVGRDEIDKSRRTTQPASSPTSVRSGLITSPMLAARAAVNLN